MKFTRITESQKSKMKLDTLRYNSYTMSEENDPDFFEKKSNRFELEFYTTDDGKEPVADFLDSLDHKMNAKLISLMELSEKTGIAQTEISKLENGTRNPTVKLLQRLADGMGMVLNITFTPKKTSARTRRMKY